ncbi:MAG: hypothetical protein COB51_10810 [Moraxellaceae bacterium]|nr:MAG: hypothetical protein COB51_10810 [Moraxellaceae bacterium]
MTDLELINRSTASHHAESPQATPSLHYDVHPGNGPAMLLIHGLLCSRALWNLNIKALGAVCTPVTVELFGHGRSPAPSDVDSYSPDNYVLQIELIRKAIGANKILLCGHSLGASLSIRYALHYPQQILGHVFTNSSSAFSEPREETRSPESLIQYFESGGMKIIEKIPVHPKYSKWLPPEVKIPLVEDGALLNPPSIARTMAYTHPHLSLRHQIQHNTRPALLVCGSQEKRFQPLRDFVENTMPQTTIVDVEAGHAVNAECADGFNSAVTGFIEKLL